MAYTSYNRRVLDSLQPGDRVKFSRTFYNHWGIYIGDGDIIHVGGNKGEKAEVKWESFWNAVKDGLAEKDNTKDEEWGVLPVEMILERAKSVKEHWNYDLLSENCEHLVNWCRYDKLVSEQVNSFLVTTGLITLVVVGGVAINKSCQPEKKRSNPQWPGCQLV